MAYGAEDGAIVGRNLRRFNNRPLYCANSDAFVLAGDLPLARFARGYNHLGVFEPGIERGGRRLWLHETDSFVSRYRAGRMSWEIAVPLLGQLALRFEVLPLAEGMGFAARVMVDGCLPGDTLVWRYGGIARAEGWDGHGRFDRPNLSWQMDVAHNPQWLEVGFRPEDCRDNRLQFVDGGFILRSSHDDSPLVHGACSDGSGAALGTMARAEGPWCRGDVALVPGAEMYWAFEVRETPAAPPRPAACFASATQRTDAFARRVQVDTPEARLNALVPASTAAIDGTWYPPVFVHGAMSWNVRMPGWRTMFGGVAYGWHDRVQAQAGFYLPQQVRDSNRTRPRSDPAFRLTQEAQDSRFYGRGYLSRDQLFYNMQSQFFDQLIHDWRWTADHGLEASFRPALELHLEWIDECFDPDNDGIYESYINTWPTDSVWCSGGGSTEETSYACRAHSAARDMARRAGDEEAAVRHEERLALIRRGFRSLLWSDRRGHPGLYREQGGHRRLHEDAWLYSVFLPIDAGLLSPEQALSALHYTEWGLQNDELPEGGRQVWTSNFVPGIWSVRELWPGDNYHLALAWFQAGMADEGWALLKGMSRKTAFDGLVPGDLGAPNGGTDFGDCVHMFARAVVEGLFGFRPDYPQELVTVAPQFPPQWDRASIRTPDFSLKFRNRTDASGGSSLSLELELQRAAPLLLRMPVYGSGVRRVSLDGRDIEWEARPGVGRTFIEVRVPRAHEANLVVETEAASPRVVGRGGAVEASIGRELLRFDDGARVQLLPSDGAPVLAFSDPQGVLADASIVDGALQARVGIRGGAGLGADIDHASVFVSVSVRGLPQWRVFHLQVAHPDVVRARRQTEAPGASARWKMIRLDRHLNADVRSIYRQEYLSPRPATVSVRIGSDGYSPWTFPHWKSSPPEVALDGVAGLLQQGASGEGTLIRTPQGVPFAWHGNERNVVFASLWDNFPTLVTVPVGALGSGVWFLVCGSTTVMQGRIANAVIRMRYADGVEESLELVPPFNYWNLSPIDSNAHVQGQAARNDYTAEVDRFAVPEPWPRTVRLGRNCRAILLDHGLREGAVLESVALEALSPEVVVGLMGISVVA